MKATIEELAARLGAEVRAAGTARHTTISDIQPVDAAGPEHITFVTDARHAAAAAKSRAAAVLVASPLETVAKPQLVVRNVQAALIETLNFFAPAPVVADVGVAPSARLGTNVRLAEDVTVGPGAVLEDNVQIGARTRIGAGCHVGANTIIGADCRLDAHVVVYHGCTLGHHVIIQANSTIGAVGFGYAFIDGAHRLIPHRGGVLLEDFVEIGANSCVDRAKFGNTIVGAGTKIDNLVQIAHNVVIGKCCVIAAQVGVAGSCRIGDGVVLAGQVGLADNIEIGAGAMVGAQAGVMNNVAPGEKLAWSPALSVREAARVIAHLLRLPKLAQEVKRLTAKVDRLEAAENDQGAG
ncbi:MAG: UDP-3-O-(3-hydroxymyristoyl)glucosamine N-acyltransferase [Planctomycetes bacterium]|jgi:UDP-3-O-[3-hydroxymyristoyl] glucosamine N-acyltransferase|nr:UDP-3-O-(3-hydroxymyristoyl)glucosamine N-acyltransferase [Planctomycetota bacterium]